MYSNRVEAGRVLAVEAVGLDTVDPLVLAIPRGGVIVAREIAAALDAEMDVVMAKKIGAPFNPEFAVAAVDPDGKVISSPGADRVSLRGYIAEQAKYRRRELQDSLARFRSGREEKPVEGRSVFLVDDGLATGLTAIAAIQYLRRKKPRELVLAVPVAPEDSLDAMRPLVDKVICPLVPRVFYAVGEWYVSFEQVDDDEVTRTLEDFGVRKRRT